MNMGEYIGFLFIFVFGCMAQEHIQFPTTSHITKGFTPTEYEVALVPDMDSKPFKFFGHFTIRGHFDGNTSCNKLTFNGVNLKLIQNSLNLTIAKKGKQPTTILGPKITTTTNNKTQTITFAME